MSKKSKKIATVKTDKSPRQFWWITLATALVSFSVLTFEIALTRIFSIMLSYHYVFAVVSFSLFGLGLGGMLLHRWRRWLPRTDYDTTAALFALFIAGSVFAVTKLPLYKIGVAANFGFWLYIFLTTLPFILAGLTLASVFQTYASRSSILYGFDLLGATLGALAIVPVLNAFGGIKAAFVAALVAAVGATFLTWSRNSAPRGAAVFSAAVFLPILAGWYLLEGDVPIAQNQGKDMYRMLNNPKDQAVLIESRWSAFGRTDLVKSALPPDDMTIFMDGSAGSPMYNLNSLLNDPKQREHLTTSFGAFFPFYFLTPEEKNNALIIGSGGGRDVVIALLGGVQEITAVEVNPDVVQIVRDYEQFNGGIYTSHPKVKAVIAEGRNFIRSTATKYDLIMLAIPVTKSSRSVEGYALTESYMFTVESMTDYFDHLTPEGRMILVGHSGPEIYRLITLALTVFEQRNVSSSDAMNYMYTMASGLMPTLVIQKAPFQRDEMQQRYAKLRQLGFDKLLFIPYGQEILTAAAKAQEPRQVTSQFDQILVRLATGEISLPQLVAGAGIDISPVTDDSPFFYKFEPGLPAPFGLFSVFIVLVTAAVGSIGLFPGIGQSPLMGRFAIVRDLSSSPQLRVFLLMFFCLGIGFMLVEIALFQKLTLYLGQPLLALTVLLFSLLLGTGLGSLASSRINQRKCQAVTWASMWVVLLTSIYALALEYIFSLGFDSKLTATTMLLPLGLAMGFPFPLCIRLMKEMGLGGKVHMMWGLNGIASVLGSALTMIIGILMGFSYALLLGAALYAGVACLAVFLKKIHVDETISRKVVCALDKEKT